MKTNPETSLEVLNDVVPILESCDDFSNDALLRLLRHMLQKRAIR